MAPPARLETPPEKPGAQLSSLLNSFSDFIAAPPHQGLADQASEFLKVFFFFRCSFLGKLKLQEGFLSPATPWEKGGNIGHGAASSDHPASARGLICPR
jgi:hypothetical protein